MSIADTTAKGGYYEARTMWRLDEKTGAVLKAGSRSQTSLENDGFMCASPTTDGSNTVVATGWKNGEADNGEDDYSPDRGEAYVLHYRRRSVRHEDDLLHYQPHRIPYRRV